MNLENPLISIWWKPRQTVRRILDSGSRRWVVIFACLGGIDSAFNNAVTRNSGEQVPFVPLILISLGLGLLIGLAGLYIGSALLAVTGRWLGGKSSYGDMRTAVAWSMVPVIWTIPLAVAELFIFGEDLFLADSPRIQASALLAVLMFLFGLIETGVGIWSLVVGVKCVAEAHRFSSWRALLGMLISFVFATALFFLLVVLPVSFLRAR